jgi:hypothetical protein
MDPETLKTLINIGIAGIILVLVIRGDLVPRPYYDREVKRGDAATAAAQANSEALKDLTDEIRRQRAQ